MAVCSPYIREAAMCYEVTTANVKNTHFYLSEVKNNDDRRRT